jgi:phage gpG-like protein
VTEDRAVVTFEDEKASYHQFGTGKMPARPFMPFWGNRLSPLAERQIMQAGQLAFQRFLRKQSPFPIY